MAVVSNQANSKLKLVSSAGLDVNNKEVIKNKTIANIKPAITNENLYTIGTSLASLQSYSLKKVVRYEEYELMNEI